MAEEALKTYDLNLGLLALKKISLVFAIYSIFYYNLSTLWLVVPIVMLTLKDRKDAMRQERRELRRARVRMDEKDVVLSKLDGNIPSWVIFPDTERVEWLNKVVKQLWPCINGYFVKIVRDSWEPTIKKKVGKYTTFKFDAVDIGSVAPRIDGIKVYDKNVDRNEIILDVNLSYASDCEVTFTCSGIKGGIEDFRLNGTLRAILKPLLPHAPIVGAVQLFFINNPSIDFELAGIADVLNTPGLNLGDLLKKVVYKKLANTIVLPKKLVKRLTKTIEVKTPEPEGVLRMHVIGAKHLMRKDVGILGKGKSDPYAVINVGSQEFRTKVVQNSVDPVWDYWCEFVVMEPDGQQILIHIWDWDDASVDEPLGRATVDVSDVVRRGEDDMWITLEKAEHGSLHVRFAWLTLSANVADLQLARKEVRILRVHHLCTSLVTVYLDSIVGLPQAKASSLPDTAVTLTVGKDTQKSRKARRTLNPIYEQSFVFLVSNPETDSLYVTVRDKKHDADVGQFVYPIRSLCEQEANALSFDKREFPLSNAAPESKIVLAISLRIFKRDENDDQLKYFREESTASSQLSELLDKRQEEEIAVEERVESPKKSADVAASPETHLVHRSPSVTSSSGVRGLGRIQLTLKYSVPRQKLIVEIHRIARLPLKDPTDVPDPYVKLYLLPERNKDSKRKTQTKKDNCNPVYEETFEYVISESDVRNHKLEILVCTQKQLFYSSTKVMGQVIVPLANYDLSQVHTNWYDLLPED